MSVFRLESDIQHYAWGSPFQIAQCLGRQPSGKPEAELWMGAHPKSPSRLVHPVGTAQDLLSLIESDPRRYLGTRVLRRFGRLPFLLKLLAAARPLSLQAHPNRTQAQQGYERENLANIPLSAPFRNYKDSSDKPETIYALTPFFALSGFRALAEAQQTIADLCERSGSPRLAQLFSPLLASGSCQDYRELFARIFACEKQELTVVIAELAQVIGQSGHESGPVFSEGWAEFVPFFQELANTYPDDPGVVTSLLLNFVRLSPGEAMFLPAGNLHAYLSGLGIELMANSDNVLRGGLTAKHVDVDELVRVLSFGSYTPQIETGTTFGTDQASRTTFSATCPQFQLEFLQLAGGRMGIEGPLIGVVLEGELIFEVESMPHVLRRGEQFFVPCGPGLKVGGAGRCAVAFVPDV